MKWIANRFQEMDIGFVVVSKFWWSLSAANLLIVASIKWDFDLGVLLIPIVILLIGGVWVLGFFLERTGFRKYLRQAQFKDVKLEGK